MLWVWIAVAFLTGVFFIPLLKLAWHMVQIVLEVLGEWY